MVKDVLFVCVENSCRSQMAEAFGNLYGQDVIKCSSCGSSPSGRVNPAAIASMRAVGYDLSVHGSKGPEAVADLEFDLVIGMGCGDACPRVTAREHRDWDIPDPGDMDAEAFARVRDLLASRVRELVTEIAAAGKDE